MRERLVGRRGGERVIVKKERRVRKAIERRACVREGLSSVEEDEEEGGWEGWVP